MTTETQKQTAHERAEQIRLGLQGAAVLYAAAITEKDWQTLGYASIKAWNMGEFGADRFSPERRKEIHALLTARGLTQRQIAAATGTNAATVSRDQREAGVANATQAQTSFEQTQTPRQQAARAREADRRRPCDAQTAAEHQPDVDAKGAADAEKNQERQKEQQVRERVIGADELEEIIAGQMTRIEIMERYGVKQAPAQDAYSRATGVKEERARAASSPVSPQRPKDSRTKNWDGKSATRRLREAQEAAKKGSYSELLRFRSRLIDAVRVLENYDMIADFPPDLVNMWEMEGILDDLINLGEWHDRAMRAAQGWLDEHTDREKIAKLRNTHGRTSEEAATALRLADRMEQRLTARLP